MVKLAGIFALSASLGQALNLNAGMSSAVNIDSYHQGEPDFERKGNSSTGSGTTTRGAAMRRSWSSRPARASPPSNWERIDLRNYVT